MDLKIDENTVQKAKALAASPQGQQLLAMLQQSQPELMQQLGSGNDAAQTAAAVQNFLRSPQGKLLIKSLEGKL